MLTFYPAMIDEKVYMVSVCTMEQGYKVYIVEKEIGVLSICILGSFGIIPKISSDYTYPFMLNTYIIDELNLFIEEHFEEFITEN